ncbi:small multidrug resistance protein [Rhizobium etli 8C-3]|uniref:Undecaprenyl phosphate-alpha-L-ara4N flippase subunit ArnE n=2 Tax=Rhizobium TaxID=379 RepID=A0A4R3QW96_9HYPH|nr:MULTISPECIES: transporter [Rhizobium]APO73163.1 small multidrug resistance protein [Rhizobium etli 8C-3]TCU26733.1 undecaprenyl phosphate-alpha-L-ara4N flippase subunit ArnE [Rhizobium azibense]TCU38663.1 undecaprenyl phosphate-alpha-L-ara4N flippase subunit ArnE [Rhizobium azibense]
MLSTFSTATWIGLVGTPLLIASGQVLFKLASAATGEFSVRNVLVLLLNPVLLAALLLYGLGTIIWIYVLKAVPLTIAYSFMGLTFCFVPLLAQLFLGEALTVRYAIGAAFIIAGMLAING